MKNLVKFIVISVVVLFFAGCKNDKTTTDIKEGHSNEMHVENDHNMEGSSSDKASVQKNELTSQIVEGYLQLKNALVSENQKKASEAGKDLHLAFESFDMAKLSDAQHKEYMEIAENVKEHAEHIVKSDINHQREHFEFLSTDIQDLITLVGTDKTLYQVYCPMYNNNKGGTWLSETKEIRNPYFGNKMLNCGEIQKQIN